jgi:leucyl aminopeptidase
MSMYRRLRRTALRALACALLLPASAPALEPDPDVAVLLEEITVDRLMVHVDALVALGTRRWDRPEALAAQEYVASTLSGLELDEVFLHDFDSGSDNVVGVLRGADRPDRLHVLGAHYDSISKAGATAPAPGADDNASGTAALLEAARVLSSTGRRPAETIVFVAFSGEEVGRRGSSAYVDALAEAGETVADMVCLDVIGYRKPGTRQDLSVSSSRFTPAINDLVAVLGEVAAAYLPSWAFEGGAGCG